MCEQDMSKRGCNICANTIEEAQGAAAELNMCEGRLHT